jgi:hypothetical protein
MWSLWPSVWSLWPSVSIHISCQTVPLAPNRKTRRTRTTSNIWKRDDTPADPCMQCMVDQIWWLWIWSLESQQVDYLPEQTPAIGDWPSSGISTEADAEQDYHGDVSISVRLNATSDRLRRRKWVVSRIGGKKREILLSISIGQNPMSNALRRRGTNPYFKTA